MKPSRTPDRDGRHVSTAGRSVVLACGLSILGFVGAGETVRGQTSAGSSAGGFMPGARELFSINFAQEPVGEFPRSLRLLTGTMEIVEKDGSRMLRASQHSEFLITLPERLPEKFTLEFDVVTRAVGYNNEELGFEGTPTQNQSSASARISWFQWGASTIGGRDTGTTAPMPDDVRALIEGQMAEIRASFDGDTFKLYTNGRRIYNLSDLKFVRGRVLRVALGGIDGNQYAVHLARLRIADATTTAPATAQQQSGIMATNTSSGGSNQMMPASTASPLAITGLTVRLNPSGAAVVTWNPLPVAAEYLVIRWNANDPACCNVMSPPGMPLRSPVWQDGVLPVPGTYAYRVIARTATSTVEAETRYIYSGSAPMPPPGVATVTPVAAVTNVAPTIGGTITPLPDPTTAPGGIAPATGVSPTGAILSPAPAPAPYSPAARVVAAMPTSPTPTDTGTPTAQGGPGEPIARYRVLLTGFAVAKPTNDDPLGLDGRGDEAFAAAAVVNWDRRTNQRKSYAFVQTRDYGDVSVSTLFPERIKAGTLTSTGGLTMGDRAPASYDVRGANLPAPAADQFPLLVWEGELTAGGDALVIAPSLWERDTIRTHFNSYKANWNNMSADVLVSSPTVTDQYTNFTLTCPMIPFDQMIVVAPPATTFSGPVTHGYKIAALAFGPSSDRPIGMSASAGALLYQERVMVVTREKVNSLNAGEGVTIAVPFAEPLDPMLGGLYTLYVRVQRLQ